jgi:hypothetical protein
MKIVYFFILLLCSSCAVKEPIQWDLDYSNYQSSIDTTSNYVEDIKEFFIEE